MAKRLPPLRTVAERNELASHHYRLVVHVAARALPARMLSRDLDDAVQDGMVGLLRAAELWDEARGTFATYATHWIRRHVIEGRHRRRFVWSPPWVGAAERARLNRAFAVASIDGKRERGLWPVNPPPPVPPAVNVEAILAAVRTARRREALRLRLSGLTLAGVGEAMGGLSRERVRQLCLHAMADVRRSGLTRADLIDTG